MHVSPTAPATLRLKPLACAIFLAISALTVAGEAHSATPNMGSVEIELPEGFEDELSKRGTSQKGHQVLEALEVKAQWEAQDEKGQNDVYRKDVSNVYVGKQDIERYKGANAADLFKGLNGVYSGESRNSGALDPNIRGIQGQGRIPVTVDGTEQATSVWLGSAGIANRNYVDPNMISSISVEKGPSTTAGVRSGIGGSVEIKTLDAEDIVPLGETYGLELKTETATNAVKPNESGMNNYGRDYRDIDGAYVGGAYMFFPKGGGSQYTPHSSSRGNDFDFNDNAYRLALATRQEHFDALAAYSYRKRGNYYSGKHGSQRYESEDWLDSARKANSNASSIGDNAGNYLATLYLPGHEVSGTSSEMETTLLKGTLYFAEGQSLKASYMHSDLEFGETQPYLIAEVIKQRTPGGNFGFQLPYSQVKQDTVALTYTLAPEDSRWLNLSAGWWMTQSDSKRHQNGEEVYTLSDTSLSDKAWDQYTECQSSPSNWGCAGLGAAPEKLPNTDGRFNIVSRALQLTDHNRWGVNLTNQMALTDTWKLTVSSDFSKERLQMKDNASQDNGSMAIYGATYLGPRSGRREQYNFSFNNEWAATPWMTLSAGARYSDYSSFDTGLDERRAARDPSGAATSRVVAKKFTYQRLMTDDENLAYIAKLRADYESYGLSPEETEELLEWELNESGMVNGYRYATETVEVPTEGKKLVSSANPFTNGTIDLNEQVTDAQGVSGTVPRYVVTPSSGSEIFVQPTEEERWAKPKKQRGSAWTPMAGVTFNLSERARLYARYSEFVRFPSVYEDSQGYISSQLPQATSSKPEHAYNWEVGYVQDLQGFVPQWRYADIRLNYFNNEIRNYIDRDFLYNVIQFDKKKLSGLELQARMDSGRYFSSFGATYRLKQQLCDKDMANTLDPYGSYGMDECVTGGFPTTFSRTSLQPQYSLNLDGGLRLFDERLELGGRMIYHSSAKNKEENKWIERGVPSVTGLNQPYQWHPIWVFDAYATVRVNEHIDVDFGVNNITNRYYLDPLARTMMPAPGRTLKMGLTARF
ncbi:TonB-dependent receptor domain-containing protein [Pseudomonas cremoricolorata]|uniref:TonB-dependent receptor n=1 Tax=Pseudomonas cremoricolorata TaxID=157783 RepID=A0A089Y8W9_9PSED|nr:TonB-dependent receptor [Pseudomonas cremoricolorata]AIR88293.1 hypothetical protein LK03_03145 [Pseudomonas cremoricolorata]